MEMSRSKSDASKADAKLAKLVNDNSFLIGDAVHVGQTQEPGVIKFIGKTQFSEGEWIGVELDKALGKNDGTVKDVWYFECRPKHGIFVRRTALLRVKQAEEIMVRSGSTKDKLKHEQSAKTKGAKALMAGIKNGDVGKIVDQMEEQGLNGTSTKEQPASPTKDRGRPSTKVKRDPSRERSRSKSHVKEKPLRSPHAASKNEEPRSPESSASFRFHGKDQRARSKPEMDEHAVAAQRELRLASEERNPENLRKALIVAEGCSSMPADEIAAARQILAFESQKALSLEIDKVRNVVAGLAECLRQTQAKAKAMEESAKGGKVGDWVTNLVKSVEGRLWQGLEQKVEEKIQKVARAVAGEMLSSGSSGAPPRQASAAPRRGIAEVGPKERSKAASKIQTAWRRRVARQTLDSETRSFNAAVFAARKRNKAWAGIFDAHCSKGGTALAGPAFHKAITEIHRKTTEGQTSILFKGYTRGTGRPNVDLAGFVGIAEAIALGDRAAAEFADVNVETFVNLAVQGGDQAATKLQSAQRQKVARAEVAARREASGRPAARKKPQYTEEEAAIKIQQWIRRRLAGKANDPVTFAAKKVKRRHQAWSAIFEEVCGSDPGLNEDRFAKALDKAMPNRLSPAQIKVLFQGYCEAADQVKIDLSGFCDVASAVAAGDKDAAEFADIHVSTFQTLGDVKADAAASKIGAVYRGRQVRVAGNRGGS